MQPRISWRLAATGRSFPVTAAGEGWTLPPCALRSCRDEKCEAVIIASCPRSLRLQRCSRPRHPHRKGVPMEFTPFGRSDPGARPGTTHSPGYRHDCPLPQWRCPHDPRPGTGLEATDPATIRPDQRMTGVSPGTAAYWLSQALPPPPPGGGRGGQRPGGVGVAGKRRMDIPLRSAGRTGDPGETYELPRREARAGWGWSEKNVRVPTCGDAGERHTGIPFWGVSIRLGPIIRKRCIIRPRLPGCDALISVQATRLLRYLGFHGISGISSKYGAFISGLTYRCA